MSDDSATNDDRPAPNWGSHTSLTMLEGMIAGDDNCWSRFERSYKSFIVHQLSGMLFDKWDVEDVCQEVITVLHSRLVSHTFNREREGSFHQFLKGICLNKGREQIRKRSREPKANDPRLQSENKNVEDLADPNSDLSRLWDSEHRQFATEFVLAEARRQCGARNVGIFLEMKRKERSRKEIAKHHSVSDATLFRIQAEVQTIILSITNEWGDLLDL